VAGYDSYLTREESLTFKILLEDGSGWIILEHGVPSGIETTSSWSNKQVEAEMSSWEAGGSVAPVSAYPGVLGRG
jgi:hypothetical protein